METPPPNTQARNISNIHATTRTETSINSSIDYEEKYHKSIERSSKILTKTLPMLSPKEEKELVHKYLNDMRKQIKYVEETNWMFDCDQILPMENLIGL